MKIELNSHFPFIHTDKLSIKQRLKALEQRASVNMPSASLEDFYKIFGFDTSTDAGIDVDFEKALTHSAVWRAINILSSALAQLPVTIYRRLQNGDTEEAVNHPAYRLLKEPNGFQTGYIFRESAQFNTLSWGNGYAFIEKRNSDPVALYLQDPAKVDVFLEDRELVYKVRSSNKTYNGQFILHIPALSFDGVSGKSPIRVARESIATGLVTQRYGNKYFANGAKQSGILQHPGVLGDTGEQNLRNSFDKNMKGKEGGTMILEEGMKYIPITIPPEDSQFLETRKFAINEIARWYGIPPHLLGDLDRATFSNIEHQGIEFVIYSLMPWIRRWEDELNRKLLKEDEKKDHFFKFNVNGLLRGDAKTRFESYKYALDMGWMNINEVRALEEMNRIEGGDKYIIQLNRTDLNNLGENAPI